MCRYMWQQQFFQPLSPGRQAQYTILPDTLSMRLLLSGPGGGRVVRAKRTRRRRFLLNFQIFIIFCIAVIAFCVISLLPVDYTYTHVQLYTFATSACCGNVSQNSSPNYLHKLHFNLTYFHYLLLLNIKNISIKPRAHPLALKFFSFLTKIFYHFQLLPFTGVAGCGNSYRKCVI